MGCGPSRHRTVAPAFANVPRPLIQVKEITGESASQEPATNVEAFEQGAQEPAAYPDALEQGAEVFFEGQSFQVQYVTSSGLLDLRSSTGEVRYGVPRASVCASADTKPQSAAAAAATAAAPAPAPDATTGPPADRTRIALGQPLAKPGGSGALVHRCTLEGVDGELAVKLLDCTNARESSFEALSTEVELCRDLSHPQIVRFLHLSTSLAVPFDGGNPHLAIVMELLPTSLEDLILERRSTMPPRPFSAARLASIVRELVAALSYLHGLSPPLLHRDLKPANIFFDSGALEDDRAESGAACRLRVGDFDTSVRCDSPLVEFIGTPVTTPPEMFAFEPHHRPADIWALGIVICWMLTLSDPMGEMSMPQWESAISASPPELPIFTVATDPPWAMGAEQFVELARRCCATQPEARPMAADLLKETTDGSGS
jgi:serine/threonine protein kinase